METRNRHLRELSGWYDEWCNPVVHAMYREDAAAIQTALDEARAELARGALSADDTLAMLLQLRYLEFQARGHAIGPGPGRLDEWLLLLKDLSVEPVGAMSGLMHDCLMLIAMVLGDLRGHRALPESMLDELFGRIPARDMDAELWFYISSWAIEHRNRRYIQLAYAEMLTEPSGYLRHDIWLRVNLMYLLMERRAGERDVKEAFRVYKHPNQLRRFEESLWPVVVEAGLDTPQVRQALEEKRAQLQSTPLEPPAC